MNRQRVIFLKDLTNAEVKNKYARKYPNIIFFTNYSEEFEQIWTGSQKVSGITRINKSKNIAVYNYHYTNINHYDNHKDPNEFVTHDIYASNFNLILNYNPDIEEMVKNSQIDIYIEGKIEDIVSSTWTLTRLGNTSSSIFRMTNISNTAITLEYDKYNINTGLFRLSCNIIDKYDTTHDIAVNFYIKAGEIIPIESLSLKLNINKTYISENESLSIIPTLEYTTLTRYDILPSINILYETWKSSNTSVCQITQDGVIRGIYSPELENGPVTVDINYTLNIEGYPIIEKTVHITVYKKYTYFNPVDNDDIFITKATKSEAPKNAQINTNTSDVSMNNNQINYAPSTNKQDSDIEISFSNLNPELSILSKGANSQSEIIDIFEEP